MDVHLRAANVLASGIHDAKNRLYEIGTVPPADGEAWHALQQQLMEVAFRLDRTLTAYRLLNHERLGAAMPVYVPHLLEDVLLRFPPPPGLSLECAADLRDEWPLSRELVEEVLINALQNAARFARARIRLRAAASAGCVVFEVNDDGPGYPGQLPDGHGVGLYIAERVAEMHGVRADDGGIRQGRLELGNGGALGGALFRLHLP